MKRNTYSRKIKFKFMLLVGAVIVLIMAIVMNQCGKDKEKRQYKEYQEQKNAESEQQEGLTEKSDTDSYGKDTNATLGQPVAQIKNLDEYATNIIGDNTDLLNQSFSEWIIDKQISASTGSIFYVLVPDSDPGSVDFFIHIDDSQGSIIMLAYHTRENVVTASVCNHTEEEIKAGVFEENGPAQCDISATEDAEFLNSQEGTDATEGKN